MRQRTRITTALISTIAMLGALLVPAAAAPVSAAPGDTVLFVAGSSGPPSGDRPIRDRLTAAGLVVTIVDDDIVAAGDEAGYDLVVIASSVVPSKIGAMFTTSPTPVLSWEGHLFDDLGMSAGSNGEQSTETRLAALDSSHPIAAGISVGGGGVVTVATSASSFSYGTVGGEGTAVATIDGASSRATILAYDSGELLASNVVAPARRVGLFMSYSTGGRLNSAGRSLVDNAIEWALAGSSGPVDSPPVVNAGGDQVVTLPDDSATLTGTVTDDGAFSVVWSQASGPSASFGDAGSVSTSVSLTTEGTYVFTLTADDSVNAPVADSMTIVVAPEPTGPDTVLFVAGLTGPPSGDRPVRDRLLAAGLDVTIVDDDAVAAGDEVGFDLIVVASSVVPSKVGNIFATSPVPLLTWEPYLFDDLDMSTTSSGEQSNQFKLSIVDASHPIANGVAGGNINVATSNSNFSYGTVGAEAQVVATILNSPSRAAVFAYESGSELVSGTASPARRVGLFLSYSTGARLNTAGKAIVDNAIEWALAGSSTPIDNPPTVDAGVDQTLTLPTATTTLTGSAADDGTFSTLWTKSSGPSATITSSVSLATSVTLSTEGTYVFALSADDGVNPPVIDSVTVTLEAAPVDSPPVVDAGTNQSVTLPTTVASLAGSVTDDGSFTTSWSQSTGPSATIANPASESSVVTLSSAGTYAFTLTADDGVNAAVSDSVTITLLPEPAGPDTVLLVAGSTGPPSGDRAVRDRLLAAGLDVTVADDDVVTAGDAAGYDLIVVASSVVPTKIGSMFASTSVPLLTWEGHLFDDMGLSVGSNGEQSGQTKLSMVDPSHPIADGVSGQLTVATSASNFSYGTVGGDALVVATQTNVASRATVFTYEMGSELASGDTAQARRVGLFLSYTTGARLNSAGTQLVDNAIAWALESPDVGVVIDDPPDDVTVPEHGTATFAVAASGEPPLSYQWKRNGVPISGATADTLIVEDVALADDGTEFAVEVSGELGSVTASATLTVVANTAPSAAFTPSSTGGPAALAVTFDATASSDDGEFLDYSWSFGDGAGGTGEIAVHTFTKVGVMTVTLTVTDEGGLVDTASATVNVSGPVALEDEFTLTAPGSVSGDVFANDTDPAGGGLTITDIDAADSAANRWSVLPIRSAEEFAAGLSGGEAEQHPRGMARSLSDPDILYFAQDVGQVWRSRDNGHTWEHRRSVGLNVFGSLSIAVDPVDSNRLLLITSDMWNSLLSNHEAIYLSTDGGDTWSAQRSVDVDTHSSNPRPSREHQENLAFDPTSVGPGGATTWFAAIDADAIYRSDDSGVTWSAGASLDGFADVHNLVVDPTDGDRLYLATAGGLIVSVDGGLTVAPLGDLPAGEVGWVALRDATPNTLYAVVLGQGLFRSDNAGVNFVSEMVRDSRAVFLHPTSSDVMYLTGDNVNVLVTTNGGTSWAEALVTPPVGLNREDGNWKRRIQGIHTAISPDPRNVTSAVAYSRAQMWRTEDGGANFVNSSELFTGYHWGKYPSSAFIDPDDPDRLAFFLFDVGMVSTDNGGAFFEASIVDESDLAAAGIAGRNMHSGGYQPGSDGAVLVASVGRSSQTGLVRSDDGAATWTVVDSDLALNFVVRFHPNDPNVVYAGRSRSTDGGLTFAQMPFLAANNAEMIGICPAQPDTLYASNVNGANNQLYRSDDRGVTWAPYGAQVGWSFSRIDQQPTFAVHATDCNTVYALAQGDLASFDGTTWTQLGLLPQALGAVATNFVRAVAVDPTQPDRLYATMMAPGQSQVWRSNDGGNSWQDVSSNLPRLGLYMPAVHPATGDLLVGSAIGTWILPSPSGTPSTLVGNATDPRDVWAEGYPVTLPSGATVLMAADGTFSYDTGDAFAALGDGDSVLESFTYDFVDVNGARVTGVVNITVTGSSGGGGPNDPPVVDAGPDQTLSLPTTTTTLTATVTDPDDSPTINWIQVGGPTSDISSPNSLSTVVTFTGGEGTYTFSMFAYDGVNPVVSDSVVVTLAPVGGSARVSSGLLAFYAFDDGAGSTVADTSGVGTPLNLSIADLGAVEWLSGGLAITNSATITSAAATAVSSGVEATDEVSIEVWLETEDLTQNGPARIVTISESSLNRNATLGQGVAGSTGDRFEARLRTTTTTTNGTPALASPSGSLGNGLSHVVFTRQADGTTRIFVDGAVVSTGMAGGSLDAWNLGYQLALANEIGGSRPWLGDLHLVAIYDKALTLAEVGQNRAAGPNDVTDVTDPQITDEAPTASTTTVVITWTTDEPTTGSVAYGTSAAYELGVQTATSGAGLTRSHTAIVGGLDAGTLYQFEVGSTDANGNLATPQIVTATTTSAGVSDTVFDLWTGGQLDVGLLGTPQRWANILGSVSDPDGVASASYSLDGAAPVALTLGSDQRRLARLGDFNVELLADDLATNTVVTISAIDGVGNVESASVTVVKHPPPAWSIPTTVDWSSVSSVAAAAVIADGEWTLDGGTGTVGIEIGTEGYNRILLVGDSDWTDYEVTVPVTLHALSSTPGPLSGTPAFGLIANWNGYNDSVSPGSQPHQGFLPEAGSPTPFGAITWWRDGQLRIVDHNATTQASGAALSVANGSTYQLKLQVDRDGLGTTYRFKMWEDGAVEPGAWGAEYTTPGGSDEPLSGSLGLMAHETAVSFGAVSVTSL